MLPVNLLNTLKALALAQKPLPTAAVDAAPKSGQFEKAGQFELGQKLQGSVQTQVAPGLFKVRVAEQLIQMQLPPSIRSGDTVGLQVITTQPRLTFGMANSDNPLSTPEQLGSTARLLSAMSQQPPEKAYVKMAQSAPLWGTPQPPESKQLAGLLHEALSNSGLFYESHQALWLEGSRSTAQLLHEPQNQPPGQPSTAISRDNAGKAVIANDTAGKTVMATGNNTSPALVTGDTAAHANASDQPNTTPLPESNSLNIPEHLQPLVQQQLNALETRQMVWQGHVWPDQPMQWEVHEQVPQSPNAEEQRQWVTQLSLELPNLGGVAATLRFNKLGLTLTLRTDTPETRAVLGSASTRLVASLAEAGIPVLSTQVATT